MKKYRKLEAGERVIKGDEFLHSADGNGEWKDMSHEEGYHVSQRDEGYIRRPVPFTGKVAFLVTVSATTRVVLDTDGLSDEEIDEKLAEMACEKISANPNGYIIPENVDWGETEEDVECPFVEDEPTEQIGEYRYLEAGDVTEVGDEWKNINGEWREAVAGYQVTIESVPIRRKISAEPRYRPFVEGDVIELGDQYFDRDGDGTWKDSKLGKYGEIEVAGNVVNNPYFRKLIK